MNPLKTPWARQKEPDLEESEPNTNPPFIGLRNELAKASSLGPQLPIEVRGVRAVASGPYKIDFSESATLRYYLYQLRLLHAASYAAVYDQTYPDRGRLRMTYVPQADSRILICPPAVGTATQHQRSDQDAERLARDMGRKGRGKAPDVVTGRILR